MSAAYQTSRYDLVSERARPPRLSAARQILERHRQPL